MRKGKALLVFGGIFLAATVLFVLALFVEDSQYPAYTYVDRSGHSTPNGLILSWEADGQTDLWALYANHLLPHLEAMHTAGDVQLVIAIEHPPLTHPELGGRWTHSAIVLLREDLDRPRIQDQIVAPALGKGMAAHLRSIDLLRLQPGLEHFYPAKDGLAREAALDLTVEYVFSDPAQREAYYRDQYVFSGPAMSDLHSRDKAGRFIGFEEGERLYGAPGMPQWDVVHLVGFTRWQMIKAVPFFISTWNKHAERAHGPGQSLSTRRAVWDELRVNVSSSATQRMDMSLQRRVSD